MLPSIYHKQFLNHSKQGLGFLAPEDTLCISIIVTSRCNLRCSYCHYHSTVRMDLRNADILDMVFDRYLDVIDWIKSHIHPKIQVRFSGGEPLVLGERLYELAERVCRRLNENVHILTNGVLINSEVIRSAAKCGISAFLISIENPFDVDKGSVDPQLVLDKIVSLANGLVPLLPAVVIVRNHMFFRLSELADWFFDRLGQVPTISELNFSSYCSPTTEQLKHLHEEIKVVVDKYIGKTPLALFPYIVPELAYCYENKYLLEFGVAPDSYNFIQPSMSDCVSEAVRYLNDAYPESNCPNFECEWYGNCQRIKWVWLKKMRDYCDFKRAVSDGYYQALLAG